ncbi:MAG TPA: hypothetical protein VFU82_00690 [Gammaproteobacteria bacterium]|nr:hypothetical protein [Gammaproteobacteria bacterium]
MKFKKIMRGVGAGVLTIGVVTAFGILSVSGAMAALANPGVGILIASFVFGGMAEGEVYFSGIFNGLKDVFSLGERGKQQMVVKSLRRLLKKHESHLQENSFLSEYQQLVNYLKAAKKSKLTKAHEDAIRFAKQRVALMEAYFADRVLNGKAKADFEGGDETTASIMNALISEKSAIKHKIRFMRFGAIPIALICGSGFAFWGASQLIPAIAGSALLASLGFMGWPLVAMAGVGFTFLIISTFKAILTSDAFSRWKERVRRWIKPGEAITPLQVFKVALKGLLVAAVVGICVAGIVATAPAMWVFIKHGAAILTNLTKAVTWVCNSVSMVLAAGTFIFSTFNSLKSLDEVMGFCKKWFTGNKMGDYIKRQWRGLRERESMAQTLDPFRATARFIQMIGNLFVALAHPAANGLGGNQSALMPPIPATIVNAANELAQDANFFMEKGSLTSKLIMGLVSPLLLISAAYQTLVSQVFNPLAGVDKPKINIWQALKNAFDLNKPVFEKPLPAISSQGWRTSVIQSCFAKEEARLKGVSVGKAKAADKLTVLNAVKEKLIDPQKPEAENMDVLNQHRLFNSKNKLTSTEKFVRSMRTNMAR